MRKIVKVGRGVVSAVKESDGKITVFATLLKGTTYDEVGFTMTHHKAFKLKCQLEKIFASR